MNPTRCVVLRHARTLIVATSLLLGLGLAPTIQALPFKAGPVSGSFDSTFSLGAIYRLNDPDPWLYGTSNGGYANSVNGDDGNLNFPKGWASEVFKGTHELSLKYGPHLEGFARVTYFYDYEVMDKDRRHLPLTDEIKDRAGRRADLLDLYGVYRSEIAGRPFDFRIGRQVLSLGESTFIPNGINVVNAVDVSKLRVPGAELREAFLPNNLAKVSFGLTPNINLEAFWLLEFRRTETEPAGTFFSTNDFAPRGGRKVMLGFGALSDRSELGAIPRANDRDGGNFNQYGAAMRIMAPGLKDTEFGLYFMNYHSRLPIISAVTPTAGVSAQLVQTTASNLATQNLAPGMIAAGYPPAGVPAALQTLLGAALTGVPASALPATLQPFYPAATTIANGARQVGLLTAAHEGRYFIEYPEDIKMVGASFNTDLSRLGIAWQGEVAYKHGVPLQVDDVELLFAALSALAPQFGANNQIGNYLGRYGTEIPGYQREDVWSAQTTFTKVLGPTFGSSQVALVAEIGGMWVPNLPDKNVLRFEAPGTFTSGNQAAMVGTGSTLPATPGNAFGDKFSWGYQAMARFDYNDVFAGVNISPSLAFSHDVQGNTPYPLGNFVRGRKSLGVAVEFTWQNSWSLELRYQNFFGAKRYNLLADRDFVSTTVKYSF
ncbi:DUF1302 domain-containing protein [Opitutus sp. ER46]|uniref:DUF1302 domain-containing protein n=1 Tax=Opitutus sp. ER46 TaxID=2161864 RepID=UPI000D3115EF|nr:DUF1302 domain-containing protein [Opitutus sp. ER46]PTX91214.1 hypothetical protein DB354_21520 [Opitutus sp. ER46]